MKKVENITEYLVEKHHAYCEIRCFDLATRPLAGNDTLLRMELYERIRRLGLRGHEECVVFALLGGERLIDVAEEYRISNKEARRILRKVEKAVAQDAGRAL